jgi:hypothetical protein
VIGKAKEEVTNICDRVVILAMSVCLKSTGRDEGLTRAAWNL